MGDTITDSHDTGRHSIESTCEVMLGLQGIRQQVIVPCPVVRSDLWAGVLEDEGPGFL